MTLFKLLAASTVGAVAFSNGGLARGLTDDEHAPVVNTSSAECEVVAIGYSKVSNDKAIAEAAADASAYICGKGIKTDAEIVEATAEAFVLAVATASAKCELSGEASAYVDAKAKAKAAAEVWVAAYASAWAEASDCEKCDADASSIGYIEKWVFLEAVAKASVKLDVYTDGGTLLLHVVDYKTELKKVVVKAFASALAGAAVFTDANACAAWVNAGGCIWTPGKKDECFECTALAVSAGAIVEIDAIASASAKAAAWTCYDYKIDSQTAEDSAKDVAFALATALSFAFADCKADDDAFTCADAGTSIEKTAYAVAEAYATIWGKAVSCKTCKVGVDVTVEAIGDILVKAATESFASVCASGGQWTVANLAIKIEAASLTAVAEASVAAISIAPHTCVAGGYVSADVSR